MNSLEAMLALNNAHQKETGYLTQDALSGMIETAFHCVTEDDGAEGLLIAFDQDAAYQSPNFNWFKTRYDRFVYVDRIIVAPHARGRGMARAFYQDLFTRARTAHHSRIVCEINLDPPNPGSLAFHAALDFVAVGEALLDNGKTVRYMECLL